MWLWACRYLLAVGEKCIWEIGREFKLYQKFLTDSGFLDFNMSFYNTDTIIPTSMSG